MLPLIIRFTIPLVLGNLLQLTYNAIDGMIVGQYVGKEALAAVGTGNPLVTLMILFAGDLPWRGDSDRDALRRERL